VLSELFNLVLLPALLLLTVGTVAAVEPLTDPTAAEQLKQLNDQTIIATRVLLDSEWDQFKHGANEATWSLATLWGWRVSDSQDWGVRLKLPLVYARRDDDIAGLGDLEIGTGTAFRLNNTWRTGGGLELHVDTASDPTLGDRVWRLKPGWGVAHDITDWLTVNFNVDYSHSIAEEHKVAPQRYLELSLPAIFILPYDWSISGKYEAKVDFENGDHWTHIVNVGVAKRLSNLPLVLSATLEKSLDGGPKKFQANFTIVYFFERYHVPK
jgi:hypothetical protein